MELELKNISVALSGEEILDSVNLKVEDGEFVSLLGASGCGKTTLLKTVAGIITPTNGSVFLDGKCADKIPPHKRGTVIVFQDFRLFPHMTVAENIAFPLRMRKISKDEYLRIASELLVKVQLAGFEGRKVQEMSGGQIQRIALARALAASPNVLLLDEPFSSLDENLRQDMRKLVLKLQREYKITTILVTHDCEEALSMSDKIALMMNGRILQFDTPKRIYDYPTSREVADFFGENVYIEGTVRNKQFVSNIIQFSVDSPDGKYQAMLRNAAVHIAQDGQGQPFKVTEIYYRGDAYVISLEANSGCFKINTTIPAPCVIHLGDTVFVTFDVNKAILFNTPEGFDY